MRSMTREVSELIVENITRKIKADLYEYISDAIAKNTADIVEKRIRDMKNGFKFIQHPDGSIEMRLV